jgi:hypothetical protein
MSDDFDSFKASDGGEPVDGTHTARLDAAAVLETRNGRRIKLTWQTTDYAYWWESWHGVEGRAKGFTKDVLAGIGIKLDELGSWDELADELAVREGKVYRVEVERNGDWLNTSVSGDAAGEQLDLPADTAGLPERAAAPAGRGLFDDDDISF